MMRSRHRLPLRFEALESRLAPAVRAAGIEYRIDDPQQYLFSANGSDVAIGVNAAGDSVAAWVATGNIRYRNYNPDGVPRNGVLLMGNKLSPSIEGAPDVALDAAGGSVIVWESAGPDGSGKGIFFGRQNAAGGDLAFDIPVNTYTTGDQHSPQVAMDSLGNFVVVWQSDGQDGSGSGIYARRYDAVGVALSAEIQVHSFTTGNQSAPAIAVQSSGAFVVTWTSAGQDGNDDGVYARRFNSSGSPLTSAFLVNSATTGSQNQSQIAMDSTGEFVISYASSMGDGSGSGIYARRYSVLALDFGPAFQVNQFTTGDQTNADVASDATGNFTVTWQSAGQDGSGIAIVQRRFDANGVALGGESIVNFTTSGDQFAPAIGSDSAGLVTIAWTNGSPTGQVLGQRFNSLGSALPGEFRVNVTTTSAQSEPSLAVDADGTMIVVFEGSDGVQSDIYVRDFSDRGVIVEGTIEPISTRVNSTTTGDQSFPVAGADGVGNFVVVWQSQDQDGGGWGIYARRFENFARTPLGPEFRVNSYTTGDQTAPAIAVDLAGNFLITWQSNGQDGSNFGVYGQRYSVDGAPLGGEFRVNQVTTGNQISPAVAVDGRGRYVVTWSSEQEGTPNTGIYARRYDRQGIALGGEFHVNTYTTGIQSNPTVATDRDGDFAIAWQSQGQDGDGFGIYAQRFDALGAAQGPEFRVNVVTASAQIDAGIGMAADGAFTIAWSDNNGDGFLNRGLKARQFAADGSPLTSDFRVNTFTSNSQQRPVIAIDADGDIAMAWESNGQDGSSYGVYAQRFLESDPQVGPAVVSVSINNPFEIESHIVDGARLTTDVTRINIAMSESSSLPVGGFVLTRNGIDVSHLLGSVSAGYFYGLPLSEFIVFQFSVAIAPALSDGEYRLTVGSTASDSAANRLDGDIDGSGFSEDFSIRFTIARPVAAGAEVQVNTNTSGDQERPVIAVDSAGNFVVAYESSGQDGNLDGVFAQRFTSGGAKLGTEFRINSWTTGNQNLPDVAMTSGGDFVVVWQSAGQTGGSGLDVYAQRYASSGLPVGGEFRVNSYTTGTQTQPFVGVDGAGNFVVVWSGAGTDDSDGIFARRFRQDGAAIGAEFLVNQFTTGGQSNARVAVDPLGNFVVTWQSADGGGTGVFKRRFNAAGVALENEALVNITTTGEQIAGHVAHNADGDFVIVWQSAGQDGDGDGVFARRFNQNGSSESGEIQVNSSTSGDQNIWDIAADRAGNFVVAWNSVHAGATDIYARRFAADGTPQAAEFRVNSFTTGIQNGSEVAMTPGGDFIVAWDSSGQDGSGSSVHAQRYSRTTVVDAVRIVGEPGEIDVGETVVQPVAKIVVGYSGNVTGAATSSNYTLTRNNIPVANSISAINYGFNATTELWEATLTFATPLADGVYELSAIGNNIIDIDGRAVDGDFDGTPGGNFALPFTVLLPVRSSYEVSVNNVTTGDQHSPAIAADAAGNYVVAFRGDDGADGGIYIQRLNQFGSLLSSNFRANESTAGDQKSPAIASAADGQFVVVWEGDDGNGRGIFARRYFANGVANGNSFLVNTYTTGDQGIPAVAMDADGDWIVTWQSYGQDAANSWGVYYRAFNSTGEPQSVAELRANTTAADSQRLPSVALAPDGRGVIAWHTIDSGGQSVGIFAQRLAPGGRAVGGEIGAVGVPADFPARTAVALDSSANFAIAWHNLSGAQAGIHWQRFDSAGVATSGDVFVAAGGLIADIVADADGDIVVAYQADGVGDDVYFRRYSATGLAIGNATLVNRFTTGAQTSVSLAATPSGQFGVVWTSANQDGSGTGVYFQSYGPDIAPFTFGVPDVNTTEDAAPIVVNLFNAFDDFATPDASLMFSVISNSNPALFSSAKIDGVAGTLTLTLAANQHGSTNITLRATDSAGLSIDDTFVVNIASVNDAPVLAPIGNKMVVEASQLSFTAMGSDPNDAPPNKLTYSLVGGPAGASINSTSGLFTWTPTDGPAQTATFKIRVTDDGNPAKFTEEQITVTVKNADPTATSITGPGLARAGDMVMFQLNGATDVSSVDLASGLVFSFDFHNDGTFEIVKSPTASAATSFTKAGLYTVKGRVEDKDAGFNDYTMQIHIVASPLVVVNANDAGPGSLRQAVLDANALAGPDTITFDPTFFAAPTTIQLTTGQITISDHLVITGPTARVTVNGNNESTILIVDGPGPLTVDLANMALSNGKSNLGGAINVVDAQLTLTNMELNANVATINGGAMYGTASSVTLVDCRIVNNQAASFGGGLYLAGAGSALLIRRSTISGNTASTQDGGGALVYHSVVVEDSTVSNNTAGQDGAGIAFRSINNGDTGEVRNSTISGNMAGDDGGGITFFGANGQLKVLNSTIVNNSAKTEGGGIEADFAGSLTVESSIVVGNTALGGLDIWSFNGGNVELKSSAVGQTTGFTTVDLGGNQIGSTLISLKLGPLADNGGPTQTHAVLAGSSLINKGTNAAPALTNDQRGPGFPRQLKGGVDIGSFESNFDPVPPPRISVVDVNENQMQRSRVTSLTINFDQVIDFNGAPSAAFELKRQSDGKLPTLAALVDNSGPGTVVTLTFSGTVAVESGSLADGLYTLRVFAGQVSNVYGQLDGNNDGTGGDDYVLVGSTVAAPKLFRLFGDVDGNASVSAADFNAFRLAYGSSGPSIFDFNGDNVVSATDFNEFRSRYGVALVP